jgi:hypothetical protein
MDGIGEGVWDSQIQNLNSFGANRTFSGSNYVGYLHGSWGWKADIQAEGIRAGDQVGRFASGKICPYALWAGCQNAISHKT